MLCDFVPQTDHYLEELIELDSQGCWPQEDFSLCGTHKEGKYQCTDCWSCDIICGDCIVKSHIELFLHKIQVSWINHNADRHSYSLWSVIMQVWTGDHFAKLTLKELGLQKQLGHPCGEICLNPLHCSGDNFVVLHMNGIHEVGINFCGCGKDNQLHTVQLLHSHLFPATIINPKACATIELLDFFSILSYESKMSAYQFYQAISRLSDNTGMSPPKVSFVNICI